MKVLQIFVLIFGLLANGNGQQMPKITLSGTVYDKTGAEINNVEVVFKAQNGKIYRALAPIDSGEFKVEIPLGIYDVKFGTNLFNSKKPFEIKKFRVISSLQKKMVLDVALDYETFKEQKVFY